MTNRLLTSWLILSVLVASPPLAIFPKPAAAQLVKSNEQVEGQVKRAVIKELPKFFSDPDYNPEIRKVTVVGNYAYVYWVWGEGGGSAIAIKKQEVWQVTVHGDDWAGIERLVKDGIPRQVAEELLDRAVPDWRDSEVATSYNELPMTISFDEGMADITVPDNNVTLPYSGRLRRYDAHIAKMFEVTSFLCDEGMVSPGIEWSYQAGGGSIDMGKFVISCRLANDIANAYKIRKPQPTLIQFSQGEGSPVVKKYNIGAFDINGNKVNRWLSFVQQFKPVKH